MIRIAISELRFDIHDILDSSPHFDPSPLSCPPLPPHLQYRGAPIAVRLLSPPLPLPPAAPMAIPDPSKPPFFSGWLALWASNRRRKYNLELLGSQAMLFSSSIVMANIVRRYRVRQCVPSIAAKRRQYRAASIVAFGITQHRSNR